MSRRPTRAATILVLLWAVLASMAMTAAPAARAAAPEPAPTEVCGPWARVVDTGPGVGWVNDRHARVWAELQECSTPGQPSTWRARAVYDVSGPDTSDRPQKSLEVQLREADTGPTLWQTARTPEPAPGSSIIGEPVLVTAGHRYIAEATIRYLPPAPPLYFQRGALRFDVPAPNPGWSCGPWTDQQTGAQPALGFVGDNHGYVVVETQTCRYTLGVAQRFIRAVYRQVRADTITLPPAGMRLTIATDRGGCVGCTPIWQSPLVPEPGISGTFFGDPVRVQTSTTYRVQVSLTYLDPPSPGFGQTGRTTLTTPDVIS